jgi:enoyl-CoA hydratase/carnithine racemase
VERPTWLTDPRSIQAQAICWRKIRDRVAVLTLNRPEARNALSDHLTPALRRMIKRFGDDADVGAILIIGAGTAFCAGGDVKGLGQGSTKAEMTFEQRVDDPRVEQRTLTGALVAVRKPTVAAIPGPAAGTGLALALDCDIRIAAQSAILTTGYARIGLSGEYGIAGLLTRLTGFSRARELMFLSERVDAQRAEALGLVNRVVPDAELHGLLVVESPCRPDHVLGVIIQGVLEPIHHGVVQIVLHVAEGNRRTLRQRSRRPRVGVSIGSRRRGRFDGSPWVHAIRCARWRLGLDD